MCILAMQAFLITIDPVTGPKSGDMIIPEYEGECDIHCLPVKSAFVSDAVSIRELSEIHFLK